MGLSSFSYICISNNPALKGIISPLEFKEGGAVEVLREGRSLAHLGWQLLASPFYGNFKPNQQPYRTLLFRKENKENSPADIQSLSLMEDAVRLYESARKAMLPGELPENIEKDFRYIDFKLLEETFRQYQVLTSPADTYSGVVDR